MEKLKEKLSYGEKCMADEIEEWNRILDKKSILRMYNDLSRVEKGETFAGSLEGVQAIGRIDRVVGDIIRIILSDDKILHIRYKAQIIEGITLFDKEGKPIKELDWEEAWDGNN